MDWFTKLALTIQIALWAGLAIITIALIVRRVRLKKEETFEKRDN